MNRLLSSHSIVGFPSTESVNIRKGIIASPSTTYDMIQSISPIIIFLMV